MATTTTPVPSDIESGRHSGTVAAPTAGTAPAAQTFAGLFGRFLTGYAAVAPVSPSLR